jgi:hypothetical protein
MCLKMLNLLKCKRGLNNKGKKFKSYKVRENNLKFFSTKQPLKTNHPKRIYTKILIVLDRNLNREFI